MISLLDKLITRPQQQSQGIYMLHRHTHAGHIHLLVCSRTASALSQKCLEIDSAAHHHKMLKLRVFVWCRLCQLNK